VGQEIKIPVEAKVDGAKKAAGDLADAFEGVEKAVGSIDGAAKRAGASLDRLTTRLEEIKRVQESLQKLGIGLSEGDADSFLQRWGSMRSARGPATAAVRRFDDFDSWYRGHEGLYSSPREAARHRRQMITTALQGTDYARSRAPTVDEGGGGGGDEGGGGGGGGGAWGGGLARARSQALAFGKSMLALAGINSAMAMAGRGIDNANEEATGIDNLKRRIGDLGVEFEGLRDQARQAGQGLGVTYVESQRLAQSYARTVGNLNFSDAGRLGGSVRLGMGLSRSYGLDLEEGNQFFGSMAKYGVARDEQSQRRLALMIGDSVARSGYSGKVDELLGAITNYSAIAARQTLTTPNVEAYANALTSLVGKYTGLGPNEASALIGQADGAVRRGGAMGEASQNFIYSALRNFSPGLSPLQAMAMWQGGLFSTNSNTFGQGPLMGMGPAGGNMTTFEKIVKTLRGRGGYQDPLYLASAMGGITGLDLAQSKALTDMATSGQLGQSMGLLKAAGVDPNSISATGMPLIGRIAGARGRGGLTEIYDQIRGRKDITPDQKAALDRAMKAGGDEEVRKALVRVAALLDQESTKGTDTRKSLADLNDSLTRVGDKLLEPLNSIRNAVVAMAGASVPGFLDSTGGVPIGQESWHGGNQGAGKGNAARSPLEKQAMAYFMSQGWTKAQSAGIVGNLIAESNLNSKALGDYNGAGAPQARGLAQWHADRWNRLVKWAKAKGLNPDDYQTQLQYVQYELTQDGREAGAHGALRGAGTAREAAAAMLAYERPKGWDRAHGYRPEAATGWDSRSGQAVRLAGSVEVNVRHPDGRKEKHNVPLKPVAAPQPAGLRGVAWRVGEWIEGR
jgi:hypothetical protein